MKHIRCLYLFLFSAILLWLLLPEAIAGQVESRNEIDLPLPARMIIAKVSPMLKAEKYDKAIETLLAFQARGGPRKGNDKTDPKGYHHPEIYFILGNCYLLQEDYDQATVAYRNTLEKDPSYSTAWLNLAKAYYEKNKFEEAGNCFVKGYKTATEKSPDYLYYGAASYMTAGNNTRAVEIFEKTFSSHPGEIKPEWKEHLVHALLATEQPRRALPYTRELARTYTGEKQIQWQEILLYQYLQLEMRKEALALARSLTRQAPTVDKWWKALVHVQLDAGRQEEALMAMTIYSFLTPLTMEEKRLLADLELQEGIPVKAQPLYEAYMNDRPRKEVLKRLVSAYRQLGDQGKALAAIDKFDKDTEDEELLHLKGELYYSSNRFDQAAASYRKAAQKKGPQAGRAWLMAGYAAWQADDIPAGKAAFFEAIKYKKQQKAATTALQQLKNQKRKQK